MSDKIQKINQILKEFEGEPSIRKVKDIIARVEGWSFIAPKKIDAQTMTQIKNQEVNK